jgi:hypothetical protein
LKTLGGRKDELCQIASWMSDLRSTRVNVVGDQRIGKSSLLHRSLVNASALMLVVASRKELSVYGSEYRFVSQFFNLDRVLKLGKVTTNADSVRWNIGAQEY